MTAYHQALLEPTGIPKTSTTTPFGLFEFVCIPYSLRNAAETLESFIGKVTRGQPVVFVYLDDILAASNTPAEHENHLRFLCERLDEYRLLLKPQKCSCGVKTIGFLGNSVAPQGILSPDSQEQAIKVFPGPTSFRKPCEFLGLVNFYGPFTPSCA